MDAISYSRALKPHSNNAQNLWQRTPSWSRRARYFTKSVWVFRSIIAVIVSRSSSPEVCDVHSRSLEASRSRVGIAEWDDTGQFCCIFAACKERTPSRQVRPSRSPQPRKRVLRKRGNNLSTPTKRLGLRVSETSEICFLLICLLSLFGHVLA